MKSINSRLLIALQVLFFDHLPEVLYTELDLGQLEVYHIRPKVLFPCALISLGSTYQNRQFQTQLDRLTITIKLGTDQWVDSSSITPQQYREWSLQFFEMENKLYEVLQDWDAYGMLAEPFNRVSASSQFRDDKMRIRHITFTATAADTNLADSVWSPVYNRWLEINGQIATVNDADFVLDATTP